ncbi:hypothetical protein Pmi06nite_69190 [Planotetraspora mira]|uniref:Uncharacterized protein n=1 Tax=Planotetraspora mira TaxID=58121 RepID=A0A8J3TY48_9ACTN|nr:hypothetical protein Pmi06nite_69190 [Planotetraspora mira]
MEFTRASGTEVAGVFMERQGTEPTALSPGCFSSAGKGEARPGSGLLCRFFYSRPPIDVLTGGPEGFVQSVAEIAKGAALGLLFRRPGGVEFLAEEEADLAAPYSVGLDPSLTASRTLQSPVHAAMLSNWKAFVATARLVRSQAVRSYSAW